MNNKNNKNKGFTLVELIVVLVILAILAAILIPALLGYIDKSKDQQYIMEAKELMTATQAGIAEAYAFDKESFDNATRGANSSCTIKPIKEGKIEYGYFSNNILYLFQHGDKLTPSTDPKKENGARAKNIIAKRVIEYSDSFEYNFKKDAVPNNGKVSDLGNEVGFYICFDDRGKIIYMQYGRNGHLVTYDGNGFTCETGDDLKFEYYRN